MRRLRRTALSVALLGGALIVAQPIRAQVDPVQDVLQTLFDAPWLPEVLKTDRPGRRPLVVVRNAVLDRTVALTCEGEPIRFVSRAEAEARSLEVFLEFTSIDVQASMATVEFRWAVDALVARTLLRRNRRGWRVVAYQAVPGDSVAGRILPWCGPTPPRVAAVTRGVSLGPRGSPGRPGIPVGWTPARLLRPPWAWTRTPYDPFVPPRC